MKQIGAILGVSRTCIYRALRRDTVAGRQRRGRRGERGERLVTVLLTVAVPDAADPEDAAALVADAAVSSALDVVHTVGVEGHLPLLGSTVVVGMAQAPAVAVALQESSVLLRQLDDQLRQVPLQALAPDLLDLPA